MSTYQVRLTFAPITVTVEADGLVEAAEAAYLNYNDGPDELLFVEVLGSCCQRGDWYGAGHPPASDYLWECEYCGTIGTAEDLNQ